VAEHPRCVNEDWAAIPWHCAARGSPTLASESKFSGKCLVIHLVNGAPWAVNNVTTISSASSEVTQPNPSARRARAAQPSPRSSPNPELTLGGRKLSAAFSASPRRSFNRKDPLTAAGYRTIFRLRAGWAAHYCNLFDSDDVIIDVYVPGDVIGLETVFTAQQVIDVLMLTSATLEMLPAQNGFLDLILDRPTSIYMLWLLGQRQRRVERRLAANMRFEPRARLALMVLDFYARLRRRGLITGLTYNLPMTQNQIGDYLGLSAVHVNRVLRSLREDCVVNLERSCVTILNLERLTTLAHGREVVTSALTSTSTVAESSRPT